MVADGPPSPVQCWLVLGCPTVFRSLPSETRESNCKQAYSVAAIFASCHVWRVCAGTQSDLQTAELVRSPQRAPTCTRSPGARRSHILVRSRRLQSVREHSGFLSSGGHGRLRKSFPLSHLAVEQGPGPKPSDWLLSTWEAERAQHAWRAPADSQDIPNSCCRRMRRGT